MKRFYTLDEVGNIASGAFTQGYISAFDPDEDVNTDNKPELDFLIEKYSIAGGENERRICVLP